MDEFHMQVSAGAPIHTIPAPCTELRDATAESKFGKSSESEVGSDDKSSPVPKDAKEQEGTWGYSTISMAMTTMGIGLLSIPQGFSQVGYVPGTLLLVFAGILTDISLCMLVRVSRSAAAGTYEGSADYFFGSLGRRIVSCTVIFDLYLSLLSLVNIFSTTFGNFPTAKLDKSLGSTHEDAEWPGLFRRWADCDATECSFVSSALIGAIGLFIIFPACLLKTVHRIRHVSTLALISLFTAVGIFCGIYIQSVVKDPELAIDVDVKPFVNDGTLIVLRGLFKMFSKSMLAFSCQFNIFPIQAELKNQDDINRVIHVSILCIATPLYVVIGLIGYFFLGNSAGPNVLQSKYDSIPGQIGACIMAVASLAKLPLYFNACREAIRFELGIPKGWIPDVITSIIIVVITYAPAMWLFEGLDQISEFTGSTTGALLGCIFPGALYIGYAARSSYPPPLANGKIADAAMRRRFYQGVFFIVFGVVAGVLGLIGVLMQDPSKDKDITDELEI